MSQKRTDFAFPRSLSPWKHALSLPNGRGAGTTVLGAPSNLKQARGTCAALTARWRIATIVASGLALGAPHSSHGFAPENRRAPRERRRCQVAPC